MQTSKAFDNVSTSTMTVNFHLSTTTSQQLLNDSTSPDAANSTAVYVVTNDVAYVTSRVIFVLIIVGGLAANIALVVAVVRGQRRRGLRFPPQLNVLLVGILSVANLLICLANGSWLIYTAAAGPLSYSNARRPCDFDAAAIKLVSIVLVVGLMLMVSDRQVSVKSVGTTASSSQRGFSVSLSILCTVLAWLYALAFSLPLVVPGGIDSEGNSQRYLCTVRSNASAAYVWTTAFFGYIGPFGVMVAMYAGIIGTTIHQRNKLAAAAQTFITSISNASSEQFREQKVALSAELSISKYVAAVTVAWCLLAAPFLLLSFVRTELTEYNHPAVSDSSALDAISTWLFVSHPISLPVITFIWRKDVCCRCIRRIFACCLCCNDDLEPNDIIVYSDQSLTPKHRQRLGAVDPYNMPSAQNSLPAVPVLLATPHGLYVQKYRTEKGPGWSSDPYSCDKQCAQKCDVFGSVCSKRAFHREDIDDDNDNTSDYNSCDGSGEDEKEYKGQVPNGRPIIRIVKSQDNIDDATADVRKAKRQKNKEQPSDTTRERHTRRTTWYDGLDICEESPRTGRYGDSGAVSWNRHLEAKKSVIDSQNHPATATDPPAALIELETMEPGPTEKLDYQKVSLDSPSVKESRRLKRAKKKKVPTATLR